MGTSGIGLVLSDVDGTLLTSDKALTRTTVDAVRALHAAGIRFTVTSSRPPQGLAMLVEPLAIDAAVGAFNGGGAPAKVVGVSDDHRLVEAAERAVTSALGDVVSATRSQTYYLDVTHPAANKGAVVDYLSRSLGIPREAIVTIGDGFAEAMHGLVLDVLDQ